MQLRLCNTRNRVYGNAQGEFARMRDEKKKAREDAIISAAYSVLETDGYAGTSMLKIAKAAKASNETLYRWYGDKRGLFEAMVLANAAETIKALEPAIAQEGDPVACLKVASPILLRMLTGERAIALNRAAAADPSGELGRAIAAGGREQVGPLMAEVLSRLDGAASSPPHRLAERYFGLLIGDLQIRRVIGVLPVLSEQEINQRCRDALTLFQHLLKMPGGL